MPESDQSRADDGLKLALEHSRAMFIYHAGQRITSLNYYFAAIAVILSGFAYIAASSMSKEQRALFGISLSVAGVVLSFCCKYLDIRNEQLVHCDEGLMKAAETQLRKWTVLNAEIVVASDEATPDWIRYSSIVPIIFALYIALSVAGGLYSIWPWLKCLCG